ncbi:MBOAT family O-acyltransferase [Metabacillus iocasae]|uniref:D-alanyl-lipoteichoic acid acyltransferase DltB (MBOAT superfamily) n=1 Tax=Priestia iocasae TaxID=2291674 RepID=A0ABS2QTM5_9BACI|nr:MBOAT family O-acyltransferase [Metabacillus iocasae]MBM7702352.1 D-alanyl-lipoteichoic acid acyltransferase DltB (MBOAT superfamily) [Metabacillus iocasae]
MLFNSYVFILCFLPIVLISYRLLVRLENQSIAKLFLVGASLYFYSFWNINYLPLMIASIFVNYLIAWVINKKEGHLLKKTMLIFGVSFNLFLLGYYKYYDFFIENVNGLFQTNMPLLQLALPLAISFFTFQQIAYIVDTYRGETNGYTFVDYTLFVTFFPQLIAGPIVHHSEIIPQFHDKKNRLFNLHHFSSGLYIFAIGLAKKVVVADTFALYANDGYRNLEALTFVDSWVTTLAYTLQLYFDFSGYCDMAIGLALLFNFKLPVNFNSPYRSLTIQDFWRRWHITLGRFFTQYLYIPLGGSRKGPIITYMNLFLIFFISGIWHGAGWTFVVWGALHGVASVLYRMWSKLPFRLPKVVAWAVTFLFVHVAWVYFRAPDLTVANTMIYKMFDVRSFDLPPAAARVMSDAFGVNFQQATYYFDLQLLLYLGIGLGVIVVMRNSISMLKAFTPSVKAGVFVSLLLVISFFYFTRVSEFIYFNF